MEFNQGDAPLGHILEGDKMKIGIDIGGSHIAIGVVNNIGIIVEKTEKRLTKIEKQNIKNAIEEYIVDNVLIFLKKYDIKSVGIAIPGTIHDGVVLLAGNIGVKNYKILEKLQDKIDLPITIRNDAKCAAIAENKYGCLKDYNRSLFLTLGTGIGGAAFLENKLLTVGVRPGYEFGHMVIERNGIECTCGRKGCFERYASMKVLKNKLRYTLGLDETTRGQELLQILRDNNESNENYEMIEKIVSEYIENLSIGINNLINIFEPEIIAIGGSFVYFEDVFLERLKQKVREENAKRAGIEEILIKTATLGNDAGIIGAVCNK